ncbi:glycine-rich cell wall structural protein-like [Cajanus cajan]|uniref:glycine-rich cell wall structural protein-like n=1 Tax=Cajanus cajan TaxID=3821 RepID=UPI00098DAF48|nr:glycine-rich cell wall structural protein-like [Cajanus cajan]
MVWDDNIKGGVGGGAAIRIRGGTVRGVGGGGVIIDGNCSGIGGRVSGGIKWGVSGDNKANIRGEVDFKGGLGGVGNGVAIGFGSEYGRDINKGAGKVGGASVIGHRVIDGGIKGGVGGELVVALGEELKATGVVLMVTLTLEIIHKCIMEAYTINKSMSFMMLVHGFE